MCYSVAVVNSTSNWYNNVRVIDVETSKLKELHSLAMQARDVLKKPDTEPRTNMRLLPNGKVYVTLYSSCFSFINNDFNHITFPLSELDKYIELAKKELSILADIWYYTKKTPKSLKTKPYTLPFIICVNGMKRIYWVHLCKEHRKDTLKYNPHCKCYITWENIGDEDK